MLFFQEIPKCGAPSLCVLHKKLLHARSSPILLTADPRNCRFKTQKPSIAFGPCLKTSSYMDLNVCPQVHKRVQSHFEVIRIDWPGERMVAFEIRGTNG